MKSSYWLVKADPDTDYSIDDFARDTYTEWTGVHNFQAIANIKLMKTGDLVYVYHSQKEKQIVGLAEIAGEPYLNAEDPRTSWAVRMKFVKKYDHPVTLAEIKAEPSLSDFLLVRHTRLSVMPVQNSVQSWLTERLS
jgi:predicted RNA-binding protein with PUA-like domain